MAAQAPRVAYTVMCQSGGLLMRKHSRWNTEAEGRAVASEQASLNYGRDVTLFRHVRGAGIGSGWQVVDTWTGGYRQSNTERFREAEGQPFILPPPSPLDDLGEEY